MTPDQFFNLVRSEGLSGPNIWASLLWSRQELVTYSKIYQLLKPGMNVLDWGAGSGHCSVYLSRAGYIPHAYMLDDPPLIITQEGVRFTKGNHPKLLPFDSASFDAVMAVGVLEHVRERDGNERDSLNELRRVLKPDGLLIITHLPNKFSWAENMLLLARKFGVKVLAHDFTYSRGDFYRILDGIGFKVINEGVYNLLPRSSLNKLLPIKLRNSQNVAKLFEWVDYAGSKIFKPICQNRYYVLQKIED